MELKIKDIKISKKDPTELDQDKLDVLVESIQLDGLLQPIVVDAENNLIVGHHRLESHRILGRDTIECEISGFVVETRHDSSGSFGQGTSNYITFEPMDTTDYYGYNFKPTRVIVPQVCMAERFVVVRFVYDYKVLSVIQGVGGEDIIDRKEVECHPEELPDIRINMSEFNCNTLDEFFKIEDLDNIIVTKLDRIIRGEIKYGRTD